MVVALGESFVSIIILFIILMPMHPDNSYFMNLFLKLREVLFIYYYFFFIYRRKFTYRYGEWSDAIGPVRSGESLSVDLETPFSANGSIRGTEYFGDRVR